MRKSSHHRNNPFLFQFHRGNSLLFIFAIIIACTVCKFARTFYSVFDKMNDRNKNTAILKG